ncbi:MlaD family protein [Gordonia amicalis]|uniref:MlaD family protein n=2 Tax=Gordoniaceae TaxID=85026 RepID=A0AAE4R5G2_9ACTN|nr:MULTISPECIES: MlaD family protein [Gordonia]KAF0968906.1 hypothetical protein BPODLACK_02562 [Gordonia sp. YY1]MCZ4579484.1 MlaD family protein [Gordonia amicalis]MDJ0452075.1 MlaD family protein [Gordonia amicalis]MDV6308145.1 MlaD family protein [Gordonia amicalis]MDV6312043.1 MlaD family protein [Gordonia amicalis]
MSRIPGWLSAGALIMTTVLGVGYLLIGVLAVDPIEKRTSITVDLTDSSGLKSGSDVVYRGVNIGTVDEVTGRTGGVRVALTYAADQRVPVATDLKIEQLSSLGEPVFAFMPNTDSGPWLEDGAHLTQTVEVPTSVAQLLGDTSAMLEQVEPERVTSLLDTLSQSVTGVESAVTPAVRRGADLLLMTLPSRQGHLDALIDHMTEILSKTDELKPAMMAAPPQLDAFGESLGVSFADMGVPGSGRGHRTGVWASGAGEAGHEVGFEHPAELRHGHVRQFEAPHQDHLGVGQPGAGLRDVQVFAELTLRHALLEDGLPEFLGQIGCEMRGVEQARTQQSGVAGDQGTQDRVTPSPVHQFDHPDRQLAGVGGLVADDLADLLDQGSRTFPDEGQHDLVAVLEVAVDRRP